MGYLAKTENETFIKELFVGPFGGCVPGAKTERYLSKPSGGPGTNGTFSKLFRQKGYTIIHFSKLYLR